MVSLLSGRDLRELAASHSLAPTKQFGQNFVTDPNTVRGIVQRARIERGEHVLEVGPGLGSLTLGLLEAGAGVTAIEIDRGLAAALASTAAAHGAPDGSLRVVRADALTVTPEMTGDASVLVANLPYNVAVPILLTVLARLPRIERGLVMVQREVAERLTAGPGTKVYGVPSVKLAYDAASRLAGTVSRSVFWPVPNVDSALVAFERRSESARSADDRAAVFAVIDAAFAQRRKTLRAALAGLYGSTAAAESALTAAGVDPRRRGETLTVEEFTRIARRSRPSAPPRETA